MNEINLLGKKIIIDKSEVLLKYDCQDDFLEYFKVMTGNWHLENGYLIGTELENKGGILYTKERFEEDIMLTFKVSSILPATRDLNAVWCSNWDLNTDYLGDSYVCGLNGWYDGLSGIERNGEKGFYTSTSLYKYIPGTEVELTCGSINGHCFMLVDGRLIIEVCDNHPLKGGHVGFSPYCTQLRIRDICIRKIYWESRNQYYEKKF